MSAWRLCPRLPRCSHGAALHDVTERDDQYVCTWIGCPCGKTPGQVEEEVASTRLGARLFVGEGGEG